jgi:hypothetical protein
MQLELQNKLYTKLIFSTPLYRDCSAKNQEVPDIYFYEIDHTQPGMTLDREM